MNLLLEGPSGANHDDLALLVQAHVVVSAWREVYRSRERRRRPTRATSGLLSRGLRGHVGRPLAVLLQLLHLAMHLFLLRMCDR